jgi:hypothetical protein
VTFEAGDPVFVRDYRTTRRAAIARVIETDVGPDHLVRVLLASNLDFGFGPYHVGRCYCFLPYLIESPRW